MKHIHETTVLIPSWNLSLCSKIRNFAQRLWITSIWKPDWICRACPRVFILSMSSLGLGQYCPLWWKTVFVVARIYYEMGPDVNYFQSVIQESDRFWAGDIPYLTNYLFLYFWVGYFVCEKEKNVPCKGHLRLWSTFMKLESLSLKKIKNLRMSVYNVTL